jgi:two-component system, response regulator FlrC
MRLLIVGSLNGHIGTAAKIALDRGAKVANVDTPALALERLRSGHSVDLVMIDVQEDVGEFIRSLAAERIHVPIVACGIGTDAGAAVRAIKAGAKEYLPLPPDPILIAAVLEAVTEESHTIIHRDPAFAKVIKLAEQIASSDATVLIAGESGTGKELLARALHRKSRRANEKFVSVNCAAIPENLLESELFGHEKGAFTGAIARRIGKFEEASGGTLLLDEISEMDPRLQAKLLRAVQEREIDRVGGTNPVKVDIRLIATTNRDLEAEVRAKRFREDLYFRINVVTLEVPPLRERPLDIEPLVTFFAERHADANAVPRRILTAAALERLKAHSWPGNVRELENTIHRAVLLAEGDEIDAPAIMLAGHAGRAPVLQDAPASSAISGDVASGQLRGTIQGLVGRTVADVERDLILGTLDRCLGNRTHAANILGISIRTLRNKLKLYGDQGVPVPTVREAFRVGL